MTPSLTQSHRPDFGLHGAIGTGQSNKGDVLKIRRALQKTGHGRFPRKPATNVTPGLMEAIEGFQRDFSLKRDGVVEPDGPTERAIGLTLAAMETDGERGLGAMRTLFQNRARAGLAFRPDPDDRAGMMWRDRTGQLLTDDQAEAVTINAKTGSGNSRPTVQAAQTAATTGQVAQAAPPSAAPSQSPAGSTPPSIVPVPAYRKDTFHRQPGVWSQWSNAVRRLPEASPQERRTYAEIFAAEGGMEINTVNRSKGGVTRTTLSRLMAAKPIAGIVPGTPPEKLPIEKIASVYRAYFDDAFPATGGHRVLSKIGDEEAAAALADTIFVHESDRRGRLIQKAVNAVAPGAVQEDNVVGSRTIAAYARLARDPAMRRRLLDALADLRIDAVRGRPDEKGLRERINHFRFHKPGGRSSP